MKGTRDVILKETERQVNNVNDHNVAASIAARLLNQDRYRCSSTAYDLPMLLRMPSGTLSPVVLPAHTLDTPTCAAHRRTDEHQSTRKCQTGIPISFEPRSCLKLEELHIAKIDLRNDQRSSSCSLHMVNCLRERHSSILTLIRAKHSASVGHSSAR